MTSQCIAQTPSAFGSPLLIKGLLESGATRDPDQEIVSADSTRLTYRKFAERVGRLASGLASLGVEAGDTVAIMDWDTNRYLECFFVVPMMGAVLHTVNVRLSAEHILYTINHAEDDVILINSEFLPLLQQIWERVDAGKKLVLLSDIGSQLRLLRPRFVSTPNMRRCLRLLTHGTISRNWTKAPVPRRSTRPELPGCRRASTSVTGNSYCTRYRRVPPSLQSGKVGLKMKRSTCRLRRFFMFTPGASPTSPPCWG